MPHQERGAAPVPLSTRERTLRIMFANESFTQEEQVLREKGCEPVYSALGGLLGWRFLNQSKELPFVVFSEEYAINWLETQRNKGRAI